MGKRIVVNPITRISGFLEIEVEVENNVITDAKSSGMLFRGFEDMLKGRPPLDAIYFTQRICGICSTAHSMGSALALEDALAVTPVENDKMLRDFTHGCEFLQNHLRHLYQYTFPDYVKGPDIAPLYVSNINDYRLPDRLNAKLSQHYVQSLKYSRLAHEMLTIIAGKAPHNHGIFVGGITVNIDVSKLIAVKSILSSIKDFINNTTLEDVNIISSYYSDYFENGGGYGNFMSYGVFDSYIDKDLYYVGPKVEIDGIKYDFDESKITENIYHAWYQSNRDTYKPNEGNTVPDVNKPDAYSWVKAPRYDGYPMEVGPLARMWLSRNYRRGVSTMDRTIARALEMKKLVGIMENLLERIELKPNNQKRYEIPDKSRGVGLIDTTRGSLGHWISIEDKQIKNYEIITPTAWNLSTTDSRGMSGVVEKALIGTKIQDISVPVEIGRIVRSFDPCVSCATHVLSDKYSPIQMRIV